MPLSLLYGLLASLALLLLALGGLWLQQHRRDSRRLNALAAAADAFAAGDSQARGADVSDDAIGQLARHLNRVIGQLEDERHALRDSEQLLRSLIDAAPIGMLVVDRDGCIESANPAAVQLFERGGEPLGGQCIDQLLLGQDAWARLLAQPNRNLEFAARRSSGSFPLEASCTPFQRDGQTLQLLLARDIGNRKQAENRLHYLAHFDPLTGTANRTHLLARLELGLQCGEAQTLLFIDLDHFKRINDTLGHAIGDQLLRAVAEHLRKRLPPRAMLARLGGDEFVVLLTAEFASHGQALAEQLLQDFRQPFHIQQYELFTSPSIGIAQQPPGAPGDATQLLKQADLALYQAKSRGRNRLAHFDQRLAEEAEQRHRLEAELRNALARDEFELYYQPQVDLRGGRCTFEALLRWHSPQRGLVNSAQFMAVLEETGLIIEATRWIFRQACRQLRRWQDEGRDWGIAVNLSPLDFRQSDLAGTLLAILAEERPPVQRLELEITETTLLDADQQVHDTLHALKQAGLTLFLDDFGTGYASLAYLQFFPFHGVKIDRQFVTGLPACRESVALVRGILVIAEQLGMRVVAEGVENVRQADFLLDNGCHHQQGFLYGRPQPAAIWSEAGQPLAPTCAENS
ncbi:putative bifunctional diguanylate cyclase/phosphodiesterase [Pseudomonas oryzae]|uniref:PAS domain S-box-containing protein/diguanylate cyclase (GGDEF) domain-containing protein n=1 Tax=Pseudomonas oryzae TaxID=1392877 RepID=A0A1H1WRT7_9PSED|nr:EAL domain-containing protein [Pseudomonas oryzae]SDS99066.1 PAS domain S-box-containing protein/diguanylate cyclase (GGDEF) domain-containing protein [Pseudomonas oryzae]